MKYEWRDGNSVDLLINGEEFFPRVLAAIDAACQEVLVETFILFEDKVGRSIQQALIEAARRGVRVVMTVDGFGSADLSAEFVGQMTEAGVQLHLFDPQPRLFGVRTNLFRRLHRKLLVADGRCAFVGGINFSADHLADFGTMAKQDYSVEVRGPIVADIRHACLELLDMHGASAEVEKVGLPPPAGGCRVRLALRDNRRHRRDIEAHYLAAIRAARQRLVIANAYFFPGYRMLRELRKAARRGVHVQLILQGLPDMPLVRLCSELLYDTLVRDGVEIYEYCDRPLHGKVALADGRWATVGSSNLDPLSLSLNLEGNLLIDDPDFTEGLGRHLQELSSSCCRRVTRKVARRGYWWRAPLVFLSFHFLRHFPAIAGQLPAHRQRLHTPATDESPPLDSEHSA
ncbi:putative cardiolipin synthase YbhO [compost metagenome]